jgi:hypothetical protein
LLGINPEMHFKVPPYTGWPVVGVVVGEVVGEVVVGEVVGEVVVGEVVVGEVVVGEVVGEVVVGSGSPQLPKNSTLVRIIIIGINRSFFIFPSLI